MPLDTSTRSSPVAPSGSDTAGFLPGLKGSPMHPAPWEGALMAAVLLCGGQTSQAPPAPLPAHTLASRGPSSLIFVKREQTTPSFTCYPSSKLAVPSWVTGPTSPVPSQPCFPFLLPRVWPT